MDIRNIGLSNTTSGQAANREGSRIDGTSANIPVTKVSSGSILATLTKGSVFAGDVIDVRNSLIKVLVNGEETLSAQTKNSSNINIGDYVKFEVQENDGNQILIKALNVNTRQTNPLINALETANIPVTERNMDMVSEMMKNEMPIDKDSINEMFRNVSKYEDANASTIVNLVRHDIELNENNIEGFDKYINYEHRILNELDGIAKDIPDYARNLLDESDTNFLMVKNFVSALMDVMPRSDSYSTSDAINLVASDKTSEFATTGGMGSSSGSFLDNLFGSGTDTQGGLLNMLFGKNGATQNQMVDISLDDENTTDGDTSLNSNIDGNEQKDLFNEGHLNGDNEEGKDVNTSSNKEAISDNKKDILNNKEILDKDAFKALLDKADVDTLKDIVSSKKFRSYIKNAFSKDFDIDISNITDGDKLKKEIEDLYNRLEDKLGKLSDITRFMPKDTTNISDKLTSVQNNLNFMSEINQLASYVQLPLKFSENEGHGDLYVYNKSHGKMIDKDVLTAFMHLDMDNLGATDVDIRLEGKSLKTSFTLDDDMSVKIVENHLHELDEALSNAGFTVTLKVEKEEEIEQSNPFSKLLEQDRPKMAIKRFSFDVRA